RFVAECELDEDLTSSPGAAMEWRGEVSAKRWAISLRKLILIGSCITVLLATATYLQLRRMRSGTAPVSPPINTLAVLPFKPLASDKSDAALELGMADAMITRLSNLKELTVRPTSAVLKYSSVGDDLTKAGRELKVESVLDGRVQRVGDRIRVTVQLIRT